MSLAFFDTSALLKLCLPESGSPLAARLWQSASAALASRLSDAEGRCALSAGHRAGLLDEGQVSQALDHWAALWPGLHVVELSPAVSALAAELAQQYPLRGGDAVQVASAAQLGQGIIVASWDLPVQRAAAALGLDVVPRVGR
ncbi:MAG: type II toxin-antitoxin system VapC family toxin [Micrococcales bacterium]|nr:type II toxin-antitoxin system VapC family toxin [Micrococcales bacterium]